MKLPLIWVGYTHIWINDTNTFVKVCRYTMDVALAIHPLSLCPPFWSF
jgi:hypothetical protein